MICAESKPRVAISARECVALDGPTLSAAAGRATSVGDAQGAVQAKPGHELGMDVMGGMGADFPDPRVGFAPTRRDGVGESGHGPPRLAV